MYDWLSILSFFFGISGIVLAIIFYYYSKKERIPVFLVDTERTEIINSKQILRAPIEVCRTKDGERITDDLTAIRIYIWNNGRESIKSHNILKPLKIYFKENNIDIIGFRILRSSREISKIKLSKQNIAIRDQVIFNFDILEQNDGACCQLIWAGNPRAELFVSGIIEGVREITTEITPRILSSTIWKKAKLFYFRTLVIINILITVIMIIFGIYKYSLSGYSVSSIINEVLIALFYIYLITPFLTFLLVVYFVSKRVIADRKENTKKFIPDSILPEVDTI